MNVICVADDGWRRKTASVYSSRVRFVISHAVEYEMVLHTSLIGYYLQRLSKPSLVSTLRNTGNTSLRESHGRVNNAVENMMTFADDTVVSIQKEDYLNCVQVRRYTKSQKGSGDVLMSVS